MKKVEWLKDLLFAPRANCLGCGGVCGAEKEWLCADCAAALAPLLGRSAVRKEICLPGETAMSASAAYIYGPPVSELIKKFKYGGVRRLDRWLAREMVRAFRESGLEKPTLIVPVPLHFVRKAVRGYNQSELLACRMAEALDVPMENALKRVRNTSRQARLSAEGRRKNVRGAFRAVRNLDGARILLIDDVCTSGSTAVECAGALRAAGAASVALATVARAADRGDNEKAPA